MFIKVNGHTSIFFHHFAKENNFCDLLFASLDGNIFPKWGLILKETANTCTFLQDPIQKGAIMKKKVIPIKVHPFTSHFHQNTTISGTIKVWNVKIL